jgi:hypothetical protein
MGRKYRNEWKYVCNEGELALLDSRLRQVLESDPYAGVNGKYTVVSLYFDDYSNTAARANDGGCPIRYKWRIRYYLGGPTKYIHLEKKEKIYGRCHKETCMLTEEECTIIIENRDIMSLFWQTGKGLLRKFCLEVANKILRPKVMIEYERTAYVEPTTNIRITLDTNISAAYEFGRFLEGDYQKYPLQQQKQHVLEVKFDEILPGYVVNIVNQFGFQQTAFSKYYLGRKKVEEVFLWT